MKEEIPLNQPVVVCRNVCKFFGIGANRVEALRGVDLEIFRGKLQLLMGPSGSGKTTLISVIAGMLTQDAGECLIHNIDLNHLPDKEKTHYRGKHIGFVFQSFNLLPTLSNEENIAIPLLIQGINRKEALERACNLLEEFGMKEKIGSFPNQLSGGQQQRVAIARGLIHNPEIVVCDEPTSFLDHVTGQMIMELIKDLTIKKNLTLIVVTHDPRIVDFADKIDYLEDGKIITRV
jgi:putative ABC transport system ATP-binding protein